MHAQFAQLRLYPQGATRMDGFLEWNFKSDDIVEKHIYDVFAGDSYQTTMYLVTKLTKNEMEWQLVGTSFAPGTVGSDFRHFSRKK